MTERRKVRWLIAHYPLYLFVRTAKVFTEELDKLLPGQFEIEVHTIDSYIEQYKQLEEMAILPPQIAGLEEPVKGNAKKEALQVGDYKQVKAKWDAVFRGLSEGNFEMSQTQVSIVGHYLHSNFSALDLPFLFNDHDHVTRTLDGEIGDSMCQDLADKTDIRGLAFTYSGGYRVIGSTHEITNISELANTKFMTSTAPSTVLFEAAGANPMGRGIADVEDFGDLANGGAIETTYLRFTGKHVLKTDHSMFLTTILTGTKFWDSLTEEQQEAFKIAAKRVAKIERIWSVDDAAKYEQDAESKGIKIVDISEEDKAKLRKAAKESYIKVKRLNVDPALVKRIIIAGNNKPTE